MNGENNMNPILLEQFCIDYHCTPSDVTDTQNHFTVFEPDPDRRRYDDPNDCFLKICAIHSKLLVNGRADVIDVLSRQIPASGGEWFLDIGPLRRLDALIQPFGYQIRQFHPFFVCDRITEAPNAPDGVSLVWYEADEIPQFRGDPRFTSAFTDRPSAPDLLGVAAVRDGVILGMAGASGDSPRLWQIGINVVPEARQLGLASLLVTNLKNEILRRGHLPYYGTALSHLASQKTALNSGFRPAWAELLTEPFRR